MKKSIKLTILVIASCLIGFIMGFFFNEVHKVDLVFETINQSRGLRNLIDRFGLIVALTENLKELNEIDDLVELEWFKEKYKDNIKSHIKLYRKESAKIRKEAVRTEALDRFDTEISKYEKELNS